jgi:two-component system cell cycle sensor histidine kinase/response regulator CckA
MAGPRILIVEDETIVAMDLAAGLRRVGYEVVATVRTGEDAIASTRRLEPDLVLMDIRLKGEMDGIQAATIIREQQRIPVVFLTAHADQQTVERSQDAAPYGYLVKPFDEAVLQRVMAVALTRARAERGERQETLDELWHSEERYRLLVDAVKDHAIVMIDLHGRIASWPAAAERMVGYTAAEVIGQPLSMLYPPEGFDAETLRERLKLIVDTGGLEHEEWRLRKDGTRFLAHIHNSPIYDRNGTLIGYTSVARDVTQERSLEAQLLQAQRLDGLGQLAGGIAHDFNNMLMVIFTRCDLLLRMSGPIENYRQYVADIRAAAMKNRDLTQQLLAAARQQILLPQVVDLNAVITSAMQLLGPSLGEHIILRTELQEPLWPVHADPGKLHQVLVNLALNARDAMPNGGFLNIETRNIRIDQSYARQHVGVREGEYVAFIVSDTGTGIPEEVRDRIYDPFFSTKEAGKGSGLGLAVVRGIIEQTGGRIWMYSEIGRGTTFKMFLPRHSTGARDSQTEEDETLVERGSETILVVEDEPLLRTIVREALEEHGYRVLEASTPGEALLISERSSETIHLLLTDVVMPGMQGPLLAERIAAERPDIRVIYMSGYTTDAIAQSGGLPEGFHYVEKPIPTNVLLRMIRTALSGR